MKYVKTFKEKMLNENLEELNSVIINTDFENIEKGTIGTIVHKYDTSSEVEFFDSNNNSIGVFNVDDNILSLV